MRGTMGAGLSCGPLVVLQRGGVSGIAGLGVGKKLSGTERQNGRRQRGSLRGWAARNLRVKTRIKEQRSRAGKSENSSPAKKML